MASVVQVDPKMEARNERATADLRFATPSQTAEISVYPWDSRNHKGNEKEKSSPTMRPAGHSASQVQKVIDDLFSGATIP